MTTTPTNFTWPIRVYYEDTDAGGVVYYANYLKFMERARTEWLRQFGIEQDGYLADGIAFVVRHVDVNYHASARFNAELEVSCNIIQLRKASLTVEQTVSSSDQNQQFVSGQVTLACVDLTRNKPVAIPKPIMEVLTRVG
ncbi:tol-pal system-associated acyl-CoA thioesterase [Neiella marina]|uniref:Tol-pal system-associated acyl-CoA thioesterase n=1 Tax=Neiella holothuriorum TaxID=2870530 RepID=A0ABS7EKJ8_9GAMM|nr:tol-pal system-associated acyl-CoA thioesterase [Neiella holothuriorum]MBW8192883.1 tol-pal system-associated acyl-CoA thioesterase [Neiella holothuriorum]